MLIILSPRLAGILISPSEEKQDREGDTRKYLEEKIEKGEWDKVPPIWVTPNFLINGIVGRILQLELPIIRPLMIYNCRNRYYAALENNLSIRAYVRYTLGNPEIPKEQKPDFDFPC